MNRSILAVVFAGYAASAYADPTVTIGGTSSQNAGMTSSVQGAVTINFEPGWLASTNAYQYSAGTTVFSTTHPSFAAAPPNDSSSFMSVGISDGQSPLSTLSFAGRGASYFGFYMGSPDSYNVVTFHSNAGDFVMTGQALADLGHLRGEGDQSSGFYVNVYAAPGTAFTSVSFGSTTNAFETDNHAYILAVPEPGNAAMLLGGLALLGLTAMRKRSAKR